MLSEGRLLKSSNGFFDILKSDDLMIGGYASIEVIDKQNDLITLEALGDAVNKFMGGKKYRNVMSNHSNVQVGEVIESYRDKNGIIHKTGVDDVGFYVVIKLREDIEKAKEISRGIRKGTLRSFSIGGQAISKRSRNNSELGQYNEIDKLELHEVTICEKGINPEAKFDILKQDVGGEQNMSDKLEESLGELNDLIKQVNTTILKENEEKDAPMDMKEEELASMSYEKGEEEEKMGSKDMDTDKAEDEEDMDKALDETKNEGEEAGTLVKGFEGEDFSTLNLSAENIEKAYEAFKAEQLEKLAYDNLQKEFATRFATEVSAKESAVDRASYDAQSEVEVLKAEFADLRKSLSEGNNTIRKAQEIAMTPPEGYPTSLDDVANMSWGDIHDFAGRGE
tara:strand:- start:149 stop:1333 length:1185 start_codon:yes stop_codon:yes gene_type:complete